MIISAGEALVDIVTGPDGSDPVALPGGGPMNTAVACARLGAPTAFLGRVSNDEHGRLIWRHLTDSGVDLRVTQRGDEPTCRAVVDGDPPVFRFHGEGTADRMLSAVDLEPLGPGPHIVHGGTLGMFREPAAEAYATIVADHDGLVSLDPNVRPQIIGDDGRTAWMDWFERWLDHTDLFRVSDADLAWIWPGDRPETVAERLLAGGIAAVVVTTADGATVHTAGGSVSAPSHRVEVVDTVGAGDSFVGALLAELHDDGVRTGTALTGVTLDRWAELLDFGARVASITVSRAGADPPRRAELD